MRRLLPLLLALAATPAAADLDGHLLQRFQRDADLYDASDEKANHYRAGLFNGYLAGVYEALEGKSVCFSGCRCALPDVLRLWLAEHPDQLDRPGAELIAEALREKYPCPEK